MFDSGERNLRSDASGMYRFTGLAAGSHRVRAAVPSGFRRTAPAPGYHDVTVAGGQVVADRDFALTRKVFVGGTVFDDRDGDGVRDASEPGLFGWRIFLDADRDGVFDPAERNALTDAAGAYAFGDLAAGSYRVRQVARAGFRRTAPSAGYYDLTLSAGGSATGRNFGDTRNVLISGSVFDDANGDRVKQSTESGLANRRVYVDADNDGVFDAGEVSVLTGSAGAWSFKGLAAGTYVVRVVRPAGWRLTTPTTGAFYLTLASGRTAANKRLGMRRM